MVITSPVAPFLTYGLLDGLRVIVLHEQHHIAQVLRVVEASGCAA